jgi:SAM-dependent methyltransferase
VNPKIDRTRVEFREGDACALPPSLLGGGGDFADAENFQNFGRHDAVLAANLLCRLPDPEAFLRDCARLVRPDGVLVLVSPYSWLEAWTPKHKWLGGAAAPGEEWKNESVVRGDQSAPRVRRRRVRPGRPVGPAVPHQGARPEVPVGVLARHGVAQEETKRRSEVARVSRRRATRDVSYASFQ